MQNSLTKVYLEALGLNEDHGAGQMIVNWEKPQVWIAPTLQTLQTLSGDVTRSLNSLCAPPPTVWSNPTSAFSYQYNGVQAGNFTEVIAHALDGHAGSDAEAAGLTVPDLSVRRRARRCPNVQAVLP